MSRALKIKHGRSNLVTAVTAVNFTSFGSYATAATISISPPPSGVTATATGYLGATTTTFFTTGTATVAYLNSSSWFTPATPGSLSSARYFIPATGVISGNPINAVTGTAGQITIPSPSSFVKGTSFSIAGGGGNLGGLIAGQTYFVLTSTTNSTAVQLTNTYANAVAGIAGLVTTPAVGFITYALGAVSGVPFQFSLDTSNRGQYVTAPTGPYTINIPGGGQGLTVATLGWGMTSAVLTNNGGEGYVTAPTVSFSSGTATATSTIATTSNPTGLIDIGYNQYSYLTNPVAPGSMTSTQYLGVVGGGEPGGIATPTNPTVKATAWIPGAAAEDDVYIVTQKGATRFQVAGKTTAAASTIVAGKTYIIASAGNTLWVNLGASVNAAVGDVFTATATGAGTGTVAFAGTCMLANQAPGSVTQGNMQITVTTNSTAFRASRLSNKYVWNYATPPVKYATAFFAGSASAVTTAKAGAEADTFANGTGAMLLGQVTNYTS